MGSLKKKKKKLSLSWILFPHLPHHIPIFPFPPIYFKWLLAWKGAWLYLQTRCVQLLCQSNTPKLLLDDMGKVHEGKWWSQRFPPSLSCHKSCLAAQNKLLLETSLLALYPLPFITSEELQKAKKKKKKSPSCPRNLWTNNTNISKSAFLSRRQGNVCHLYNQSFLLPLWPFEEFNRANCSSFTRGDGYDLIRHLRQTVWLSHMERLQKAHFFTSVECQLEDSFPVLFFLFFQFFSSNLFQTQTAISETLYGMLYGSGMHSAIQNKPASKRRTQAMMCQAPSICSNLSPAP